MATNIEQFERKPNHHRIREVKNDFGWCRLDYDIPEQTWQGKH